MSLLAVTGKADYRPASYAAVRDANDNRAAANAELRQQRADAQQRVGELTAQERVADTRDRQADAARQQAALVQATTGSVLNVYA
ncbi:hypothetical protein [Cryptosporangium phraense]|uniref:Uncharacterized protein n=1 Tax=Cryptosporangium phraense TaxID=2593070 RepID=A0A545AG05_9ACTN|nr:hypothetical protein [Cryptosporangium phraense]TQS40268.1 hypothetical protein FL583_35715 [Cryptosporangium phraense]